MSETKPRAEQVRFISDLTGEHVLDEYIEACERAGVPLYEMLDIIFDSAGDLQPDFIQFRIYEYSAGQYHMQYRFGPYANPNDGWVNISEDIFGVAAGAVTATAANAAAALASQTAAALSQSAAAVSAIQSATYATNSSVSAEAAALRWTFDPSTTMADPGTGYMRLNNATLASITQIAVSNLTANQSNPDLSAFIDQWDDSSSSIKGTVIFRSTSAVSKYAIFNITSATTVNSGWRRLNVTYVASSGGLFSASETIAVGFSRAGDAGTLSSTIIASTSADALDVGPSGATNPIMKVNCSVASAVNGIEWKGAASGSNVSLTAISPDANAGMDLVAKGFSTVRLYAPNGFAQLAAGTSLLQLSGSGLVLSNTFRSFTANDFFTVTAPATQSIPASTEITQINFNSSAAQLHQTGGYALQRDARYLACTHTAAGASAIVEMVGWSFSGAPIAGTNVTSSRSIGVKIESANVGSGVTDSYGFEFNAQTGATNNYVGRFVGGKVTFAATASGYASLNVPHGTAPSSPVNGDIYATTAGGFWRINGVNYKIAAQEDGLSGEIDTAVNRDYTIMLYAPYAMTINRFVTQSASGTCTAVLKNTTGTVATNSVSSSLVNNTTITNAAVAAGEKIYITISSNSAAKAVAFSVIATRAG